MSRLNFSQKNNRNKLAIWLLLPLLLGALVAMLTMWLSRGTPSNPAEQSGDKGGLADSNRQQSVGSDTPAVPQSDPQTDADLSAGNQLAPSDPSFNANQDQQALEEQNRLELQAHVRAFFDEPQLDANGLFISKPQPVTWDSSCNAVPEGDKFTDLRDEVKSSLSLPLERFPSKVLENTTSAGINNRRILSLNQFYRDAKKTRFFQLSLVRGNEEKDTFKLEVVESGDAALASEKSRIILAPPSGDASLTYEEGLKQMELVVADVQKRGFVLGTRGVVYAPPNQSPDSENFDTNAEVVGGKVTSYQRGKIACQAFGKDAKCSCVLDFSPPQE